MRLMIIGLLDGYATDAAAIARKQGAAVVIAPTPASALDSLRQGHSAELAMIDVRFDVGGFVTALAGERIHLPVVACGVDPDPAAAAQAIRAGALEYVALPPDAVLMAAVLRAVAGEDDRFVHRDPLTASVLAFIDRVAPSDATLLITGESGTGKEVLARHTHARSRRARGRFVAINCAAIPENLLESELFGHEKGAFSGAVARRVGKFEEAHGGTLLLDEIGELDLRLQAKLLRAIQEREIDRIGGRAPVPVDIRLIAATNKDLEAECRAGRFREDLFFRLNVLTVRMPALHERPLDIVPLAEHFVAKYCRLNGTARKSLTAAAAAAITAARWRGNVRELENAAHRAVLLTPGDTIDAGAFIREESSSTVSSSDENGTISLGAVQAARHLVGMTVADVERVLIIETLQRCLGNRTHAAGILGISLRTLRNKLRAYMQAGIPVPPAGDDSRGGR